jgi:hypothetical protein
MDTETTMKAMGEDAAHIDAALEVYDKDKDVTDDLLRGLLAHSEIPYRLSDAQVLANQSGHFLRTASDNFKNIADRINTLIEELYIRMVEAIAEYHEGEIYPIPLETDDRGIGFCKPGEFPPGEERVPRRGLRHHENEWNVGVGSNAGECKLSPLILVPYNLEEQESLKEATAEYIKMKWDDFNDELLDRDEHYDSIEEFAEINWYEHRKVSYEQYIGEEWGGTWIEWKPTYDAAVEWVEGVERVIKNTLSAAGLRDFEVYGARATPRYARSVDDTQVRLLHLVAVYEALNQGTEEDPKWGWYLLYGRSPKGVATSKELKEGWSEASKAWNNRWAQMLNSAWEKTIQFGDGTYKEGEAPPIFLIVQVPISVNL